MEKCLVFCAAACDGLLSPASPGDLVIAADGGLRHTERLGIEPDIILGDFDSLGYTPKGAKVFPVEKDDTDAMLAVRRGLQLGCREFVLYGSLDGPRLDHTVANFQTLQFLCNHGAFGYLVGQKSLVTVLKNGTLRFPSGSAGNLSVFAMGDAAQGVSIQGAYYSLQNGTLTCGFPLGVSNHFTGSEAEISVKNGSLLVIWDRETGLPQR